MSDYCVVIFAFYAEHNLSFSLGDQFSSITSVLLPNSESAYKFSSTRSKTTGIIRGGIMSIFVGNFIFKMTLFQYSVTRVTKVGVIRPYIYTVMYVS